jgi:hypothetical protein
MMSHILEPGGMPPHVSNNPVCEYIEQLQSDVTLIYFHQKLYLIHCFTGYCKHRNVKRRHIFFLPNYEISTFGPISFDRSM